VRTNAFLVSVAIPAFNEAKRIRTAIESVRAQTEAPAEILVIDDGSSDDTAAAATSLGARVIVQSNAGIARTRNRLLREARFPWLAFLDADDIWYPDKLAAIRAAHDACPDVDFITSDLRCRAEDGATAIASVFGTTARYRALPKRLLGDDVVLIRGDELGRALAIANFIGTSTVAIRRDRMLERGLFFDETLRSDTYAFVAEDVEWYLRVLRTTDALAIAKPLGEYRFRTGSLASNYGRVRYGDVKLGERVIANPGAYVAGAAPAFLAARRGQLRHAARIYARAHDFARAQEILREAQDGGSRFVDSAAIALLGLARTRVGGAVAKALGTVV